MKSGIQNLLTSVEKPARYLGGEYGSVHKDPAAVKLSLALCFPETYEIGMSHQGMKVLYDLLAPDARVACERVFAPWVDLMDLMDREAVPPWSMETGRDLGGFDVVGFSLLYELTYTNMLHMLRLAGIPLRREDRSPEHPLIIAGGPSTVNPEPVADFLDLAAVGEAEELLPELVNLLIEAREKGWDRPEIYRRAQDIEGVYAPALFEPRYADGRLAEIRALDPEHPTVRRRVLADLAAWAPPTAPVSPWVKPVHDRLGIEISRGCTRGCRFCQAGYIYRPVREREAGDILKAALTGLDKTGEEDLALLSLSAGDHTCAEPLVTALMDAVSHRKVGLSLPSLRVDSLSGRLIEDIRRVRKTGFTLAPEAGSQRLRDAINKQLSEEQILATSRRVFELGWNHVKLYFMVGLPGETDEDLLAIGALCDKVAKEARAAGAARGKKPVVHASLGVYVPKPHTPFQWEAQPDIGELRRRLSLARQGIRDKKVAAKGNDPEQAVIEAVLSRGDRRLSRALEIAVAAGCRFDGWREVFSLPAWLRAIEEAGLTVEEYTRARDPEEALPWDHIDVGVSREFFQTERGRGLVGLPTADCRNGDCQGCGVCDFEVIEPRTAEPMDLTPPPPPQVPEERTAYRMRLMKTGPSRLLGHLDTLSQLVRAFRRSGLPLAHSHGFHPHPMVKSAGALPLGVESLVEVLEVTILGRTNPAELTGLLNPLLPQGLELADAREAFPGENLAEPEMMTYRVVPPVALDPACLDRFGEAEAWPYIRRSPKGNKEIDLKAAVLDMRLEDGALILSVTHAGARPKPAEVLEGVFGLSAEIARQGRALKIAAGDLPQGE